MTVFSRYIQTDPSLGAYCCHEHGYTLARCQGDEWRECGYYGCQWKWEWEWNGGYSGWCRAQEATGGSSSEKKYTQDHCYHYYAGSRVPRRDQQDQVHAKQKHGEEREQASIHRRVVIARDSNSHALPADCIPAVAAVAAKFHPPAPY